ncbi:hypothetical protein, partial [Nostoc sp. ChiQUE01b]|uniref:hypothetical protein n=1 Tax=Nostoc sp. ChiQUE01b TaxID=3075376 RepID=UPI002AD570F2
PWQRRLCFLNDLFRSRRTGYRDSLTTNRTCPLPPAFLKVTLTQTGTDAQIQVTDTGKGIKLDFLPYVFEHFRQEGFNGI